MTFDEVDQELYQHIADKREDDPNWRAKRDELTQQWLKLCDHEPSAWERLRGWFGHPE